MGAERSERKILEKHPFSLQRLHFTTANIHRVECGLLSSLGEVTHENKGKMPSLDLKFCKSPKGNSINYLFFSRIRLFKFTDILE